MNIRHIILMVCLILVLAGCEQETTSTAKGKTFIGGTEAIEFNFMEGSPPPEVYDGGNFPFEVTLNVENKGEYDVNKDEIKFQLIGFYPEDFNADAASLTGITPDEDLAGAYIDSEGNQIPGGITYVNFPELNYIGQLKGNNEFPIRAEVCYEYGTKSQTDLCILRDLTKTSDKVCEVNEQKVVESSSSPIQIENFEESVAGTNKITFSFEVVHRGTGLISKDAVCSDALVDKNKVKVTVSGIEDLGTLTCSGIDEEGYVTLYGGKRLVRCTIDLNDRGSDFEKKVYIDLEFYYAENKQTTVLVKHATAGTD